MYVEIHFPFSGISEIVFHCSPIRNLLFYSKQFSIFLHSPDITIYFIISSNTAAQKNSPGKPLLAVFRGYPINIYLFFFYCAETDSDVINVPFSIHPAVFGRLHPIFIQSFVF